MTIKNASSIILFRYHNNNYYVLMGIRNSNSKFMPNKLVFPGGAYENDDSEIVKNIIYKNKSLSMLKFDSSCRHSQGLPATALRELWEETGIRIAKKKYLKTTVPKKWVNFCKDNFFPNFEGLDFFFRAITPPGRVKRFDARFFLCDSKYILGNIFNFNSDNDELFDLSWINIEAVDRGSLPRITKKVLDQTKLVLKDKRNLGIIPYYTGGSEKKTDTFITQNGVKVLKS